MIKGNAKSIRAMLKNIADCEKINFQIVLVRYLHERLLYRVANSQNASNFILKGGLLMYAIEGLHIRPTTDIDMSAKQISNDKENLKNVFIDICNVKYDDDCVVFDPSNITVLDIAEEMKYSGVRLLIKTLFDTIKQTVQIDIGFGDIIVPAPVLISFPVLLQELNPPKILAYPIETVIAEKFSVMITRGIFNSRMKDFYDVYILLKENQINDENLRAAIMQTFMNRKTGFEESHPLFNETFRVAPSRQIMWKAFLRKMKVYDALEFPFVVKTILERLQPIYYEIYKK
ncbi:MAG: nucleotidyl transferase AbiEii/AbiGii toxin family protein [Marinilabiliaceae bacterium]|nr:nucleotidyl transferase AbiEii/AbiGii toxin family protein [Marinilabiliaceae bacterium]